jgi:hypothetical protein
MGVVGFGLVNNGRSLTTGECSAGGEIGSLVGGFSAIFFDTDYVGVVKLRN